MLFTHRLHWFNLNRARERVDAMKHTAELEMWFVSMPIKMKDLTVFSSCTHCCIANSYFIDWNLWHFLIHEWNQGILFLIKNSKNRYISSECVWITTTLRSSRMHVCLRQSRLTDMDLKSRKIREEMTTHDDDSS